MTEQASPRAQLKIFRASDAPGLMESGCMKMEAMSDAQREGLTKLVQAGYTEGDEISVLVDMPGFSLTHAWLKKDYPLMRHSHDADCMYYIVAGSLTMGKEELGPRDCFFVPAGAAYMYTPGPEGVEVLEVRHEPTFNFVNLIGNDSWWDTAAKTCADNLEGWREALPPSQR